MLLYKVTSGIVQSGVLTLLTVLQLKPLSACCKIDVYMCVSIEHITSMRLCSTCSVSSMFELKFSILMVPYWAQAQHLGAKVDAKQFLKKRGQQAVSLAELTPQVMADPDRMHELQTLWHCEQEGPEIFRLEVTNSSLVFTPCCTLLCACMPQCPTVTSGT